MNLVTKRKLDDVLEAIKGSGGVKYVVAQRLNVSRPTLDGYLAKWSTAQEALDSEEDSTGDMAETIIRRNIEVAMNLQAKNKEVVDSTEAWRWLRTRRRDKFSERKELSGPDGGAIPIGLVEVALSPESDEDDDGDPDAE